MGTPAITITTMSLFSELRRRNVFKVALVYGLASWMLIRLVHNLHPLFGLPHWTEKLVGLMLLVGCPLALYFAYIYEITPVGLKKTIDVDQTQSIVFKTGQKLNAALAVLLVLLLAALIVARFFPDPPEIIDDSPTMQASAIVGVPPRSRALRSKTASRLLSGPTTTYRTSPCTTLCAPAAATSIRASPGFRISSST